MKLNYILLFIVFVFFTTSNAQKKPIDHTVYDKWQSITNAEISKSGNFIFYTIQPQEGDATAVLKNAKNNTILEISRASNLKMNKDENFLIARIIPTFDQTRIAKIKKLKEDKMPKDSLFIFNIKNKTSYTFPQIKSFQTASTLLNYIAFQTASSQVDSLANANENKKNITKSEDGNVLHLLNLETGDTTNFQHVQNYFLSDNEKHLIYYKKHSKEDSLDSSGLYLYNIASKSTKKISHGEGEYKQFTYDDQNNNLIFLADKKPEKSLIKDFKVYLYTTDLDSAKILIHGQSNGIPKQWYVSGDSELKFSKTGNRIFFGLAPIPRIKDTTLVEFEHAKLDIWHWQDDYLQPMQLVNLKRDQSRNYTAMIDMRSPDKIKPLSDQIFNRIRLTDDADNQWALASSDEQYRISSQWEGSSKADLFVISIETLERKLVAKNIGGQSILSPKGDYVLYFNQESASWNSFNIQQGKSSKLIADSTISFVDEMNDMPNDPRPYGIAGWSKDGKSVYIYDRYDIWKFNLGDNKGKMITAGQGRLNQIVYRYQKLNEPENPRISFTIIAENDPIFLNGFNETNKFSGLYKLQNNSIKELWSEPFTYKAYAANKKNDKIIYTKEDYENSPDLYLITNESKEIKITDINTQQSDYNWGTATLVNWKTPSGKPAKGILYKPENLDPNKKYPVIAYFYEKLSDGLYTYHAPTPTPSRLNISYFVSNEYIVFAPDIEYEIGYPGKSAEEFVNSGMHYLARNYDWVDSTKMGIQGQSWGGYQVAHLITRTNMYAAAWAGAPVVNMTSAYGGIRWQTGMSRQFQYEHTQSRIGKPLWDAIDLYIENSPLFFMENVKTPVAIMHNDNDGAVPWYQGIEFFTALRRLNKPVWLLNYNGDAHNLVNRQNKKDIQIRESQFFDHFLKGKPAPNWIKKGVKATEKGIDWGLESN